MTENEATLLALQKAMEKWQGSLDPDDFEGDPRDLVLGAFAFAFRAGMEWQKILEEPA